MVTEKDLMKFGFTKDESNRQLEEVFEDGIKLNEVYIDIYPENPLSSSASFTLLLRTHEKNVSVSNDDIRLILKKNDRYNSCFMNILLSKVDECFFKITDSCYEFILNVQNIFYRITVLN